MEERTDITPDGLPSALDCPSSSPSPQKPPASLIPNASHGISTTPDQACPPHQSDSSLERTFGDLKLTDEPDMFVAVGAIFQHAIQGDEGVDLGVTDRWRAVLERANESSRRGLTDIEALKLVRKILDHLWSNGPEEDLVNAARVLADACREVQWRIPFCQSGILDFFLEVTATEDVELDLSSQTLRLIGNACADTDSNRESVVSQEFLLPIIKQLQNDSLANLVIPVLYNICVDYEPAQEAIRENSLCPEIIELLARDSFDTRPLLGYICPLLSFSVEQFDASQSPDYSVRVLLETALEPEIEVEDLVSLVNAIVVHLKLERFQRLLVEQNLVEIPLIMMIRSFAPQTPSSNSLSIVDLSPLVRDPEEEEQLSSVRSALIRALSDVSAIPEFGAKYPVDSQLVNSLILWLSASRSQFQICSCIMLGNLARSDTVCHSMVHNLRVHEILAATVKGSSDIQVLHAALGFLRNLALPLRNKFLIGEAQIIEGVSRFWSMDFNPQLQHSAVSLVRQLLNSSLVNVQRLLTSLSSDPDSPAHEKTYLSLLLSLFEKTDQVPTRVEIARAMAAIWRCLNIPDPSLAPSVFNDLLHRLFSMHADIARPLAMMVTQARWPVVRSEGWFALALMARSQEGSAAVNSILQEVEVFGALVETLTGRPIAVGTEEIGTVVEADTGMLPVEPSETEASLEQGTEMRARNRENAMVLINELLKNSGDSISVIRRNVLEDLLSRRQSNLSFQELMLRVRSLE
ncbi:hypothetical protein MMC22_005460 [Lobaria immixta]|nr:hypothetical protein [Lobaria immixta]